MFNETSYPTCGLGDAAAIQRKLDKGKTVNPKKLARFGFPGGDPIVPIPVPYAPGTTPVSTMPLPLAPPVSVVPGELASGSSFGLDLGGIGDSISGVFNMLPWYGWAAVAYFLFFRKKR